MEKARRQALSMTSGGKNMSDDGATNSSPSYMNVEVVETVEAVGGMLQAQTATGAPATSTSATSPATATATAAAGAKLVKRGPAGGSASWVGNTLSAKNNGTERNGGRKRQKQEHPTSGANAQDENEGSENAMVAMTTDENYQGRLDDRIVLQDLDTFKGCPDSGWTSDDPMTSSRSMCSAAGSSGAAGFCSAALNKSIPEQTSNDIRKFKALAANTRASTRPETVRVRRAPSKYQAEGDETPSSAAGKRGPPLKGKGKGDGKMVMPRTFAEIAHQNDLPHRRTRKVIADVQGGRSAHIFCTPAEGATLVDCDCTFGDYVRHIERSKADFVVKEMDRRIPSINRMVSASSSNAAVASDAMAEDRARLSGALASSVSKFKARNKKGALPAQRALVSDINESLISLVKGVTRAAAGAAAVAKSMLVSFHAMQADVSWLISLIDDPSKWESRARDFQACVVCGQTEKPLALEELNCVICQCRIAKGDIYCFVIGANCGVRCVTHRSTHLMKHQLDDMDDRKHAPRLDAFTQCNGCRHYVHHTCGMSNRAADPTGRETYICCGCRVHHATNLAKEVGQTPEGSLIRIGKPAGSGGCRTTQGFPIKHNPKPDSLGSIEHTHMSAATEDILREFLQAAGQRKIGKEVSFRELSHRYIKYIDRGASRTPMRFRGELGELRALPPAKFMRTFYGLFWKVDGVDALVFAVTTQTTEDGDLYVEYMDSVNLLPLGLLRPDLHRLVVLCIIAHQRALNNKSGRSGGEVKLWSFPATKAVCYLLHVHPKDMKNLEKKSLRSFYRETFTAAQLLGLTSACLAPTPPSVEGSGDTALCVLASRHVPVNGYIDTRMGEVASTAKNAVDKPENLPSCWRKTDAACRVIMHNLDNLVTERARTTEGREKIGAFVRAISHVKDCLVRGEVESAGELMRCLRTAATTLVDSTDEKRANDLIENGMDKLVKINSGLLDQTHPPVDMILLRPPQSQHELTLKLFRGSCIDDAADIFCARMTTAPDDVEVDDISTICVSTTICAGGENGASSSRTATTDGKGGKNHHVQGGLDVSAAVAVNVGRGTSTGGPLSPAGQVRGVEPMEGVEESNADAGAAAAAAGAGAAGAAASCTEGVSQSRSALLQPTEAVRGVLDTIVRAMRSAVAHPDKDRGRKSRPLFDSAPALLKLCEERGFQFDTPVNARYSTSMLLYFCNRPESLRWVCYVCSKAITKGVRFCCHTHAINMCEECAAKLSNGRKSLSLTCSPGCTAGLVPRDVIAIESSSSSSSSTSSCAEVEMVLSVGAAATSAAGAAAAAAPRQTGRKTRSSTVW